LLCNRFAIALLSLHDRFAIALLSLHNRFAIALLSFYNRFAIALLSFYNRFATAYPLIHVYLAVDVGRHDVGGHGGGDGGALDEKVQSLLDGPPVLELDAHGEGVLCGCGGGG
jgi:hypothetical protein